MAIARIKENGGIAMAHRLEEGSFDTIGFSIFREALLNNPIDLGRKIYKAYRTSSTISRVINQIVEQVAADANIFPNVVGNDKITNELRNWWKTNRMSHFIRRSFKEFLITGEVWNYVPKLGKKKPVVVRPLVPWNIQQIEGYSAQEWEKAQYLDEKGKSYTLTPENTAFLPHDALFGDMRGISPFASLHFTNQTYEDWLQGRVRINRMAGNVIGKMKFNTVQEAAASLPNASLEETADGYVLNVTGPVELPPSGSVAVLVGEGSDFSLITPNIGAGSAKDDGEAIWRATIESSRLPEFMSGWGRGVNVATARVQYPFAVRMMLALRDEFDDSITETIRLVLARMAENNIIPRRWKDSDGRDVTPQTANVSISWPEIRELDWEAIANAVIKLIELGILDGAEGLFILGWDKDEIEKIMSEGRISDKVATKIKEALDEWLAQRLDE